MSKIVCIAIKHPVEPNLFLHGLRQDNGKWALAGGHAIPGETDDESANRELAEETGLKGVKLDKIHERIYGDNHIILFHGHPPADFNLSAQEDPDREFVTFKWLDPTSHNNMHISKERNILVDWMKSQLHKDQPVIKFPKVPDLPTRLDQELKYVPSGKSKAALRQKAIISRSAVEKLRQAKKARGLPASVHEKYVQGVYKDIGMVGEAGKRSASDKTSNPGFVSTPSMKLYPEPFYEATHGVVSKDYVNQGPGKSVPEHEAAHLLMTKVAQKYGKPAQRKIIDHFIAHFHPEDRNAMFLTLTGGTGRAYKRNDPNLQEEMMNHFRDYLSDSNRREYLDKWAKKSSVKLDPTRMKAAWKNATKYMRNITPEWLKSPHSEVETITDQARKLRPMSLPQSAPTLLAASEDMKKSRHKLTVEPFSVEPHEFNPQKHDFIVRASSGSTKIGFLAVTHKKDGLMPFNLEVKPHYRRKGFATAMIQHAQAISKKPVLQSPDMTQDAKSLARKLLPKTTEQIIKAEAAQSHLNNLILFYPVTMGNKSMRSNGQPIHMTVKSFGDSDQVDHNHVNSILDQHKLHESVDPNKMMFSPHKLKGLDGTEHHVLLAHGAPDKIKQVRSVTEHIGPHFAKYTPHISVDKEDWDRISKLGHFMTAKDLGIKFHPAELRSGNTVLKTY